MADQWLHMYQQNLANQPPSSLQLSDDHELNSGLLSDATVVTAAVPSSATPPTSASSLSPDGRVGKPVRRRSRASRRTPTTLLNTDAANFRAMVQQFTGGPSNSNVPNFTFGFAGSQPPFDPTAAMLPPAGYHLPPPQHQPFQYQNQPTPPPLPFMFSLSNDNSHPSSNTPVSEAFLQTHGGSSRPGTYMGLFDGSSQAHLPRPS